LIESRSELNEVILHQHFETFTNLESRTVSHYAESEKPAFFA